MYEYLVLIDDRKRALYDEFGEEGLGIGMAIGQRYKTPEQVCRYNILRENQPT
jgi:DnaJ-class molecular chaperone